MLAFHQHIISELLEDHSGGLVVLASGLSLHKLISSLLLLHSQSQGTVLILSASDSQKSSISRSHAHLSEITSDFPAQHRQSLYSTGQIFFITSRILIVDLLTSKIPVSHIAGLIILNAHKLSEACTEAFIVRLLRIYNHDAYIRAFTDRPHAMLSGFAKAERIMKCLFIRKLHLWPRFHVYASEDLERDPPEVVDVRVPLSPFMKGIQNAVLEAMDACLKELRKTNKVDVDDLTVENGLFKSFDEIVYRQLDPIWHTVGRKTKQLVADLRTLRKLVDYLVRYDAVTYLKYLDTLRVSEGVRSVWIFADSSYKIFEYAKKRVYRIVARGGGNARSKDPSSPASKKRRLREDHKNGQEETTTSVLGSSNVVLEEVLEEAPKWKVLREILEEIQEEREARVLLDAGQMTVEDNCGIVLVACKDEHSCLQLESCIEGGPQKVMRDEWKKYLLEKTMLHGLQTSSKKKIQEPKGFGVFNGVNPIGHGEKTEAATLSKSERDALVAVASRISSSTEDINVEDSSKSSTERRGEGKRRGKGKLLNTKREVKDMMPKAEHIKNASGKVTHKRGKCAVHGEVSETDEREKTGFPHAKPLPPVQFYAMDCDSHILEVMKPSAIIVYHPNMAFVREIEVYKAENSSQHLKVYFIFYDESTEVQKFEASIRRENEAFESLIKQKSSMMIPADQDGRAGGLSAFTESDSLISQNLLTRKAGGRRLVEKELRVIVDIREFMSSLPNILHQKGMRIIPVTLEVGDYILSPLICAERKSISDLYASFFSGRLYNQVEMMSRYYRIPVLLIEFSQDKSFSFQSASEIGDDVTLTSIISKLSLLVMHFPRLRLVWSRSLYATAEIFASLKANQDEPDESKAIRVGVPSEDGIIKHDVRADSYNTSAVEFLRRLPGVTDANYRAIMDGCGSLAELALFPTERLAELMGGQKAAQTLRDFLDAKCPSVL